MEPAIVTPFCENVNVRYRKLNMVGRGTFGIVYKAISKDTGKLVALKEVLTECETEGFPITALREITIMKVLRHENIVQILEVCKESLNINKNNRAGMCKFILVMEYCSFNLAGLLANLKIIFALPDIKGVLKQILNGVHYLHVNSIIHRDIKAPNILITRDGVVKVCDFGLSRSVSRYNKQPLTTTVVTLWYRAPELLLGDKHYGTPMDMWSVGCMMPEFWTRTPILKGSSEIEQLNKIINLCGSITTEVWPKVRELMVFKALALESNRKRTVNDLCERYIPDLLARELIEKLLVLDPAKRISANDALSHDFFYTDPLPRPLDKLLAAAFLTATKV